jgi:hypothetical protein
MMMIEILLEVMNFQVEEDGLEEDEYVNEKGEPMTKEEVHLSLAEVLKKHQVAFDEDLERIA